uniref:Uncharacterized protein n=1 Tax=Roseihalotalea indica TaxID=2867963 RepID=A0AA49GQR2_9BACT|nr:hypothetical protein K4G66_05635 [Tunicatimonas sp. TK19036]
MKTTFISLALLLWCSLAIGQNVHISEFTKVNDRYDLFIIGGNEQGVFTGLGEDYYYNGLRNKQVVSYYDFEKGQQESRVLKPEDKSREYFYSFYFQDQLHMLTYEDKLNEEGMYQMYLESYDKNLERNGEEKDISHLYPFLFSFDVGNYFRSYFSTQYGKMRRSYFFSHTESADQSKVAIFFNYNFFSNAETDFQCLVLDENMDEIWSGFVKLPKTNSEYHMLESYALTNDGTLYALVSSFGNSKFKKSATDFEYLLYKYHPDQGEVESIDIPTNDRFIINLGMQLNNAQQPVLAGIYANPSNNDIEGGILIRNGKVSEYTFPESDTKEINAKDDKEYAEEYTVKNLVVEDDGSVVFFAESYKRGPVIKPKLGLGGLSPIDADVQLGDIYQKILAVKISDQAESWLRMVDKTQKSTEERDLYTSYALAHYDNTYFLLFNNDIKNASDVSMVKLTSEGDISLETIFDRKEYRFRMVPSFAKKVHPGNMVVPLEKSGKQALAHIQF